jgi:hypothetical protein
MGASAVGGGGGLISARPALQPQFQQQQPTGVVAPNALPGTRAPASFGGPQQQQAFGAGAPRGAASVPFGNGGVGTMPPTGVLGAPGGNQSFGARPPFTASSSAPPNAPFKLLLVVPLTIK